MRIDNLEFRQCSYLWDPPEHISWEICKWEPNNYYQREKDFILDGEFYHPKSDNYQFVSIHKDCFKYPETSYSIVHWVYNNSDDCYELKFIGDRPLNLSAEEWSNFKQLLEYGFKQLNPRWYEDSGIG